MPNKSISLMLWSPSGTLPGSQVILDKVFWNQNQRITFIVHRLLLQLVNIISSSNKMIL